MGQSIGVSPRDPPELRPAPSGCSPARGEPPRCIPLFAWGTALGGHAGGQLWGIGTHRPPPHAHPLPCAPHERRFNACGTGCARPHAAWHSSLAPADGSAPERCAPRSVRTRALRGGSRRGRWAAACALRRLPARAGAGVAAGLAGQPWLAALRLSPP